MTMEKRGQCKGDGGVGVEKWEWGMWGEGE
jgi:hypothetical protein